MTAMPRRGASRPFGCQKMRRRLAENRQRRHRDERAFQDGGEILGLVMAEGVSFVGRCRADAQRDIGDARDHDVDDAFQRVGQQRDGARHPIGGGLSARGPREPQPRLWIAYRLTGLTVSAFVPPALPREQ